MQQTVNEPVFDNAYEAGNHFNFKKALKKFRRLAPLMGVPPGIEMLTRHGKRVHIVHTGRVNHLAKKKHKRKLFKKLGGAIKKGAKFVKKVTIASIALPALIPLAPVMKKALKSKGITPPKGVQKIARLFYENIVQHKNSKFEAVNFDDYAAEDSILPLAAIVPPIIGFIKDMVNKSKAGHKLNATEKEIADAAQPVIDKVQAAADNTPVDTDKGSNEKGMQDTPDADDKGKGMKGFSLSPMVIVGVVVAVVVLWFVMRKK